MRGKLCGYPISKNRKCRRRIGLHEARCWQHREQRPSSRLPKRRAKRQPSTPTDSAQPSALSLSAQSRGSRQRLQRPDRKGQQGRITDDDEALRWLAERTRAHTAGNTRGLTAYHVMRNYHGVASLKGMTRPGALPHQARAIFAGGTCLALGHKLVERYSEDMDVVIAGCADLGPDERDEVLDALADALIQDLSKPHVLRRKPGTFIKLQADYQRTIESTSDTGLCVVVDAGFADDLPARDITSVPVETYLSIRGDRPFASHYSDLAIPAVPAVKPRVTMAEKLIALHQWAAVGHRKALASRARDVMDIGAMATHEPTLQSLTEPGSTIADFDTRQAKRAEGIDPATTAGRRLHARRPPGGFADSPAWRLGHPMNEALRDGYRSIGHLIYDRSKMPPFEDVVTSVHEIRDLL